MVSPQVFLGKKAAKAVVKHTAHGTVSKARRQPVRATTLLGAGALLGAVAGYLIGLKRAAKQASTSPMSAYTPPTGAGEVANGSPGRSAADVR